MLRRQIPWYASASIVSNISLRYRNSLKKTRIVLFRVISFVTFSSCSTHQFKRAHMVNVGCAYVLRRRVNYVTALNEMVKSGNVGHLACIFTFPVINPKEPHGTPSAEECAKSSGFDKKNIEFSEKNYYPLLCKCKFGNFSFFESVQGLNIILF